MSESATVLALEPRSERASANAPYHPPTATQLAQALFEAKALLGDEIELLEDLDGDHGEIADRVHLVVIERVKKLVEILCDGEDFTALTIQAFSFVEIARMALSQRDTFDEGHNRTTIEYAIAEVLKAALRCLSDPEMQGQIGGFTPDEEVAHG